ncbi:hypothetical protein [Occultella kanbiaonis]|uniref:hypothetical protein n=1 Tax=Occultella kanbiaonis TaxID=2675754 RepID=UPI0012B9B20B|nr:hypothetical protein [Occultella kanbiaonis]
MSIRTPSVLVLRVVQGVWIVGFLIGTGTHVADLVAGGTGAYEGFPTGVRLFWTSLTVLDAVTAVLIVLRLRAGIVLGAAVILAAIAVNWTVFATVGGLALFGVVSQTAFAAFILVTMRVLWLWFGRPTGCDASGRRGQ